MSKYVAVWIDHHEARIFEVHPEIDEHVALAPRHVHPRHPKGAERPKDHPEDQKRFFHEVTQLVAGSEQILLVGPSTAKLEFIRYAEKHDHALAPKIIGVETVDHPTDGQLVAYAKKYFKHADPLL